MGDVGKIRVPYLDSLDERFRAFVMCNFEMGYGRMMQIVSEVWREQHGDAALTVGDTYASVKKKIARCKREGHDWGDSGTEYDWCDRCAAARPRRRV